MDVTLRAIVDDEIEAFVRADGIGFGDRWSVDEHKQWARAELDRTVGAFVDDEIVATGRNYSLELTMPGGGQIPVGGVSWISTRPTHRRQGLLTAVMTYLIHQSRDRGEPASILTASEGGIYPRFGYGVASRKASIAIGRSSTTFRELRSEGTLRIVDADAGVEIARPLFDVARRSRAGAVTRTDAWWADEFAPPEWIKPQQRFDVVFEIDGAVEGYALYAIDGGWSDGFTEKYVAVRDLIAVTSRAEHALWDYLFHIDQTVELRAWNTPLDSSLPWWVHDARAVRMLSVRDWLWLRPIDTAALLASREYASNDELVVDVTDPWLELEETVGRFAINPAADVTCRRTEREADIVLNAEALGAISLGAFAPSQLARASRIEARDRDALARADAMFRTEREPFGQTWF